MLSKQSRTKIVCLPVFPTIKAFLLFHFSNPDSPIASKYGNKALFNLVVTAFGNSNLKELISM